MSEINWDDNAKAAISEFADWLFSGYAYLAEVDKFLNEKCNTQTKTVADAYEYLNSTAEGKWFSNYKYLCYRENNHWFYSDDKNDDVICTREQFEAYAKEQESEQEGEKWTHLIEMGFGNMHKCRAMAAKGEFAWLEIEDIDEPMTFKVEELKPIKPKLTESQYDALVEMAAHFDIEPAKFNEYMNLFDTKFN